MVKDPSEVCKCVNPDQIIPQRFLLDDTKCSARNYYPFHNQCVSREWCPKFPCGSRSTFNNQSCGCEPNSLLSVQCPRSDNWTYNTSTQQCQWVPSQVVCPTGWNPGQVNGFTICQASLTAVKCMRDYDWLDPLE